MHTNKIGRVYLYKVVRGLKDGAVAIPMVTRVARQWLFDFERRQISTHWEAGVYRFSARWLKGVPVAVES